jgi:hypothetical protein
MLAQVFNLWLNVIIVALRTNNAAASFYNCVVHVAPIPRLHSITFDWYALAHVFEHGLGAQVTVPDNHDSVFSTFFLALALALAFGLGLGSGLTNGLAELRGILVVVIV